MNLLTSMSQAIQQISSDDHLIALWLFDRSIHTQRAYKADIDKFRKFTCKQLRDVALPDLVEFAKTLKGANTSRYRSLSAIKSLLTFGHETGYLPFDVGEAMRLPTVHDRLADRILPEEDILRMIQLEENPRNHLLLMLFYATGIRCTELCNLHVKDIAAHGDSGQITVLGKGGKVRSIRLTKPVWDELTHYVSRMRQAELIFPLSTVHVWRIVKAAAKKAGITQPVSPHWFRHAHGSHALDHGAPLHLVQATLGHVSIATTGRYLHARPQESSGNYLSIGEYHA